MNEKSLDLSFDALRAKRDAFRQIASAAPAMLEALKLIALKSEDEEIIKIARRATAEAECQ